jgi:hypothetical protein
MVRQTVPALFVISMAVASAILVGSGFNDQVGVGIDLGLGDYADDLRQQAHEDQTGSVIGGALTMIGLAIAAIDIIFQTFIWVYAFPVALGNLGLPMWFTGPVGLPVWFVNLYGTAEIIRGMRMS